MQLSLLEEDAVHRGDVDFVLGPTPVPGKLSMTSFVPEGASRS